MNSLECPHRIVSDGRTEPRTDGVERLLDLLLPMATQVKIVHQYSIYLLLPGRHDEPVIRQDFTRKQAKTANDPK